jgi:polar amino acid transport system substrate-binding protein
VDACALGEVHVVCATLGVTAERARRVRFTHGYFETALAVLVRADSPVQTLDDLVGRRVGAGAGTTSEKAVYERLPFSHAIVGPKSAELLERGEVEAVVMDAPAADRSAAESGGKLRVLAEDVGREVYALAVARRSGRRRTLAVDHA